ncbi:MAG: C39 family peptidase [Gammaproteobacteria bacterium]|nr:C39 family peptidase [Gammaproteobacteria bacterium]
MIQKHPYLLLAAALLLGGCAGTPMRSLDDPRMAEKAPDLTGVRVDFVAQSTPYSCGAAALESVTRYWDKPVSEAWILKNRPPAHQEAGYSLAELRSIAQQATLQGYAVQGTPALIEKHIRAGRPVIIPLETKYLSGVFGTWLLGPLSRLVYETFMPTYSHFVIVFGFDDRNFWVMDPAYGVRAMRRARFEKEWARRRNALLLVAS